MYSRERADGSNADIDNEVRRTRTITAIGDQAGVQSFQTDANDKNSKTSVFDYIHSTYPAAVNHDRTQYCINVGSTKKNEGTYFLAEHLYILPEQQYKHKLVDAQVTKMIYLACRSPSANRSLILNEGLKTIGLGGGSQPVGLREAGISIDTSMVSVPCQTLSADTIAFGEKGTGEKDTINPKIGRWSTLNHKFRSTNEKCTRAHFFKAGPNIFYVDEFELYIRNFLACYSSNGLTKLSNDPDKWQDYLSIIDLQQDIQPLTEDILARSAGADLLVLILPKKNAENQARYGAFKTATDQALGRPSVCLSEHRIRGSIRNFMSKVEEAPDRDKTLAPYVAGVALKLNLCIGNTNHVTVQDSALFAKLRTESDTNETLFLGADVVHPSANSAPFTPSIAAVVGSVDMHFTKYLGSMRCQTGTQEIIADLADMVEARVKEYKVVNGAWPRKIMYYRDGVGDSQYQAILEHEVSAIRNGWQSALVYKQSKDVAITAIVVTKRHHVRFYPAEDETHDENTGNCMPGTVVESGITSPYYNDFYLQSQQGLKGTARPAHYFVLVNEVKLSSHELQNITNVLCYNYARSQMAVSYAPPAYYADHLAERGKAYLRPLFDGENQYKDMDEDGIMKVVDEVWSRGHLKADGKGKDKKRKNPWHPRLDGKMFWL